MDADQGRRKGSNRQGSAVFKAGCGQTEGGRCPGGRWSQNESAGEESLHRQGMQTRADCFLRLGKQVSGRVFYYASGKHTNNRLRSAGRHRHLRDAS